MATPAFDKDQRRIIHELRKAGALSRSALAERLEISHTALTRISRELLTLGLVEEVTEGGAQGADARRSRCGWRRRAAMRWVRRRTRACSTSPSSTSRARPSPPTAKTAIPSTLASSRSASAA
ncbi:MarR family transcriptional regulator [Novosphingobium resinovorum]